MARYDMKELGEVKRFLGFDVMRDRKNRKIFLSQQTYIRAMLKKFVPLMAKKSWYASRTGSLNWVSTGIRPDITYTTSRLSDANAGPSQDHIDAMHHPNLNSLHLDRGYDWKDGWDDDDVEEMRRRVIEERGIRH
ncbi:hypothetical protein VTI74DRAFT_7314 [Chaetomium olivicolor]